MSIVDLNKSVLIANRTGKVVLGSEKTIDIAMSGRGKLIILAENCPDKMKDELVNYAKLSELKVYTYPGTSFDLGEACGKPFPVAAMAIRDPGDSDILALTEVEEAG